MSHVNQNFVFEVESEIRQTRKSQLIRAELVDSNDKTRSVVIRNISKNGIGGVIPNHSLSKDEVVRIVFAEECSAEGTVVWNDGDKFGVRLFDEIDPQVISDLIRSKTALTSQGGDWEVRRLHKVPSQHLNLKNLRRI